MATLDLSTNHGSLEQTLTEHGQSHVAALLHNLPERDRQGWRRRLEQIKWDELQATYEAAKDVAAGEPAWVPQTGGCDSTLILSPLRNVVARRAIGDRVAWQEAHRAGELHLAGGHVAAVMVAGGQGTRLGCSDPKGMFPVGPLSQKSLYQWCCEQLLFRSRKYHCSIPYIIMTSEATHEATVRFFHEHRFFGLDQADVWFICQGMLPAVDQETGEVLLAEEHSLALSPDGHGGLLDALTRHNVWQRLRRRGIDTLSYHQVDNPLSPICEPSFLGWHLLRGADVTTKVARKRSAEEKMGLVMEVNRIPQVVEYSDISDDIAGQRDAYGDLRFWAGNTGMHVFNVNFLEGLVLQGPPLPLHVARKAVPFWENGRVVQPETPNAIKFERFIFDVIPRAENALFVEADREAEFQPIKNRTGQDSPQSCRTAILQLHRRWLQQAGVLVADEVPVEISPLAAQGPEDLSKLLPSGTTLLEPIVIHPN